jgi:hypothetical protein
MHQQHDQHIGQDDHHHEGVKMGGHDRLERLHTAKATDIKCQQEMYRWEHILDIHPTCLDAAAVLAAKQGREDMPKDTSPAYLPSA